MESDEPAKTVSKWHVLRGGLNNKNTPHFVPALTHNGNGAQVGDILLSDTVVCFGFKGRNLQHMNERKGAFVHGELIFQC